MANWYYYDANGYKMGPVTGGQLKGLAKIGRITPETVIETEEGKKSVARKVSGLTFVEAMQSAPPPLPVPDASPFAVQTPLQPVAPPETFSPSYASPVASNAFSSAQTGKMDYERSRIYFGVKSAIGCGAGLGLFGSIFIVLIGFGMFGGGVGNMMDGEIFAGFFLFLFGCGLMAVGVIVFIKVLQAFKNNTVSDAEIDKICADYLSHNLKSMALQKLGIDEDQVQEIAPIQFDDYHYENLSASTWRYYVRFKWGKDRKYRASNYHAFVFFFSAEQIYCYEVRFSLLEDKKLEMTHEYFYDDIVAATTQTDVVARGHGKQLETLQQALGLIPIVGPILSVLLEIFWPKVQTVNFTLFTSGEASISATVYDTEATERSIQGMKSLLRSKKQ